MFVEKIFSPSLHVEFVFLLLRLVLKDSYVVGSESGWTGLGGTCSASSLCLLVSLCSLPLSSARLKEHLFWHVAGTAVFPV